MPITLRHAVDGNATPYPSDEFNSLVFAGIATSVDILVHHVTLNNIQDELLRLDRLSDPYVKMLFAHLSAIDTPSGIFEVTPLARNILRDGKSSNEMPLQDSVFETSDFDPKIVLDNIMLQLFDESQSTYVDASISPNAAVFLRHNGGMLEPFCKHFFNQKQAKCKNCVNACMETITPTDALKLRDTFLVNATQDKSVQYVSDGYVRMSMSLKGYGRVRVTIGTQRGYPDFSIRKVPNRPMNMARFHLSEPILNWLTAKQPGLHLVVGRPRMGKTALLAALIQHYSVNNRYKITTIESPIEYTYRHGEGIINQIELGEDIKDMRSVITKVKTDDPDVVLITEIRTREDMAAATELANLGICVLSTYHAADVYSVFSGAASMFADDPSLLTMFNNNIRTVIFQDLVETATGSITPVHGILQVSDTSTLRPPYKRDAIETLQMQATSTNKHHLNDYFNLHENGIISDATFARVCPPNDESIDFKVYPVGSDNRATMNRGV